MPTYLTRGGAGFAEQSRVSAPGGGVGLLERQQPCPGLSGAERAGIGFLWRSAQEHLFPAATLATDPDFDAPVAASAIPGLVRRASGVDLGFEPGHEVFSVMLALAHVPTACQCVYPGQVSRLAAQVDDGRWRHRYRFFPAVKSFACDLDCTAVAAAALFELGFTGKDAFQASAEQLLAAASPLDDEAGELRSAVMMVYWEDGLEPGALPRGRKHDAVACANALYAIRVAQEHGLLEEDHPTVTASFDYVVEHLLSENYLVGTRYYPSPEPFLHAAARLCARSAQDTRRLARPLSEALLARRRLFMKDDSRDSLNLALLIIAADYLGIDLGQEEQRAVLAGWQRPDGSWPAAAYYRMGRFPLYFGSPQITTIFAVRALHPRH